MGLLEMGGMWDGAMQAAIVKTVFDRGYYRIRNISNFGRHVGRG